LSSCAVYASNNPLSVTAIKSDSQFCVSIRQTVSNKFVGSSWTFCILKKTILPVKEYTHWRLTVTLESNRLLAQKLCLLLCPRLFSLKFKKKDKSIRVQQTETKDKHCRTYTHFLSCSILIHHICTLSLMPR
jgi:hypothetical protein